MEAAGFRYNTPSFTSSFSQNVPGVKDPRRTLWWLGWPIVWNPLFDDLVPWLCAPRFPGVCSEQRFKASGTVRGRKSPVGTQTHVSVGIHITGSFVGCVARFGRNKINETAREVRFLWRLGGHITRCVT